MGMGMGYGVFTLVHAVILLVVSFFVLSAVIKSDSRGLKAFGYVIVALLWICALLVFSKGIVGKRCVMMDKGMMAGAMDKKAGSMPMSK
jgi:uncharacterized membrane protein